VWIPLSHIHTFDVLSRSLNQPKVLEFKAKIGNLAGFKKEVFVAFLSMYHVITLLFSSLYVFCFVCFG
jgi:hypothetical protein